MVGSNKEKRRIVAVAPSGAVANNTHAGKRGNNSPNPLLLVAGAAVIVVVAWALLSSSSSSGGSGSAKQTLSSLEAYFSEHQFADYGKTAQVVFEKDPATGKADRATATVRATKRIPAGATLFSVPRSDIIDAQSIQQSRAAALMLHDNSSHLMNISRGDRTFMNVFFFSFFLMHERRQGAASHWAGFFASLPDTFASFGGALYWPASVAACLDASAAAEFKALQALVPLIHEAANLCCTIDDAELVGKDPVCAEAAKKDGAGSEGAFTLDEARWAVAAYLRYNFRDQAIVPGLTFARRSNSGEGVFPFLAENKPAGTPIGVVTPRAMLVGDEAVWNVPRGPASLLVTMGMFEPTASAMEAVLQLPPADRDAIVRKTCHEHYQDLQLLATGRPRDQLVKCVAALLGTRQQRKNINFLRQREPELLMYALGNITGIAHRQLKSLQGGADQCELKELSLEHRTAVRQYIDFAITTYDKSLRYLVEETNALAGKLGVTSPFLARPAPAPETDAEVTEGDHHDAESTEGQP